jgi:lipopolysaccharide transport system ATP-binding protein
MAEPIIRVEKLGKRYVLGASGDPRSLRESFSAFFRRKDASAAVRGEFWALREVGFEVGRGEVLGIIGRNGAGKSTLLKILSRITEPTVGCVTLRGRVASLLEVGTGFHPELSGRENIFLNGAILGMSRAEIRAKFDEIVAFAEVEHFLDTPVKRYSSGMYVRLAFAVAAHLEPEILIIDEVLAVGDAAFQKKCLGKMSEVASQSGRTVLFVSHNMAAVQALCGKALVLAGGRQEMAPGDVGQAVGNYLKQVHAVTSSRLRDRKDRQGAGAVRLTDFTLCSRDGRPLEALACGQSVEFRLHYETQDGRPIRNLTAGIGLSTATGVFTGLLTNQIAAEPFADAPGRGVITCRIPKLPLAPGLFTLNLILRQGDVIQDWVQEAATLTVEEGDFFGTGRMPPSSHGGFLIEQEWFIAKAPDHV